MLHQRTCKNLALKMTEQMGEKHPQAIDHSSEAPMLSDGVSVNIDGLERIVKS